jgi:CMP-N,N'-diacetyllegionaminic acid synthase
VQALPPTRVLWLVTARAGSRAIPHKNVADLGGHPLLAYRIAAARAAGADEVWLSTDDEDYGAVGQEHGATVPFLRPPELASDTASSIDVVLHAIAEADAAGIGFDVVALLEPTSPFVRPATLAAAVERLAAEPLADAIVATRMVRPSTFYVQPAGDYLDTIARRLTRGTVRRQDEPIEITPSGGFYIARRDVVEQRRSFCPRRWRSWTDAETRRAAAPVPTMARCAPRRSSPRASGRRAWSARCWPTSRARRSWSMS